jgi:hypothetical protein
MTPDPEAAMFGYAATLSPSSLGVCNVCGAIVALRHQHYLEHRRTGWQPPPPPPPPRPTYAEFRAANPNVCSCCGWTMNAHRPSKYMLDCPYSSRQDGPRLPDRREVPNPPDEWREEVARREAKS